MQARLLCVGDMHLGRRPSRLPERLAGQHGISPSALEPRAAWRKVVDRAIQSRVDAVLLAGDVVDSRNHFMEAYGALLEGAQRLKQQDIDLVCVAGNHDVEALPRLAEALDNVHLLGPGGTWTSFVVKRDGEPRVRVIGWSFPDRHVESNPLDAMSSSMVQSRYDDGAPDDLCTVGLLHCDLDAGAGSRYAPVSRTSLANHALNISAWFLGHVHAPTIQTSGRPVGYLGSLVGLDAGEPGAHGPWLAELGAGQWQLRQLHLSPIRWENRSVDVEGCNDAEALAFAMGKALQGLGAELAGELDGTRVVGARLELTGACAAPSEQIRLAIEQARELDYSAGDVHFFIDKVTDQTRLPIDLAVLSTQSDPAGLMARRLLALEAGGEACADLISQARSQLEGVSRHGNFGHLPPTCTEDEEVRQLLLGVARRALEELLSQKSSRTPATLDEGVHA